MTRIADGAWPKDPGEFTWIGKGQMRALWFRCPQADGTGVGELARIPVAGPRAWQFDGNDDRPTLTPSVRIDAGGADLWHGFVTAGELVTV